MSQTEAIERHLKSEGSISPIEAIHVYGCYRLAARIKDLRDKGIKIKTTLNRDLQGHRYARYVLA
tara:strand:+ start:378 stop:572 length:195 start_codon:yes stop_codon:yes gene_type:complete